MSALPPLEFFRDIAERIADNPDWTGPTEVPPLRHLPDGVAVTCCRMFKYGVTDEKLEGEFGLTTAFGRVGVVWHRLLSEEGDQWLVLSLREGKVYRCVGLSDEEALAVFDDPASFVPTIAEEVGR